MGRITFEGAGVYDDVQIDTGGRITTSPLTLSPVVDGVMEKVLVVKLRGEDGSYATAIAFQSPGDSNPELQAGASVTLSPNHSAFLISRVRIPNPSAGEHHVTLYVDGEALAGFTIVF